MRRHLSPIIAVAVLALLAVYAGVGADPYLLSVFSAVLVTAVAVSGLNLLAGYGGYPNLSQAMSMGVGAYAAAVGVHQLGLGFWAALGFGPAVAAVAGAVLAGPLLRLRGQYFAIATLLLAVVFTTIVQNIDALGGTVGIGDFDRAFTDPTTWFLFLLAIVAILTIGTAWMARRPFGRNLDALRQDEGLSESVGIAVYRRKYEAFVIGSAVGGLGGVLLAYNDFFIAPPRFDFFESFLIFVALVVGGSGTVVGPLLGSLVVVALPEVFRFADEARYLFVGVVFVLVLFVAPDGIVGAVRRLTSRLRKHIREPNRDQGKSRQGYGSETTVGEAQDARS